MAALARLAGKVVCIAGSERLLAPSGQGRGVNLDGLRVGASSTMFNSGIFKEGKILVPKLLSIARSAKGLSVIAAVGSSSKTRPTMVEFQILSRTATFTSIA